MSKPPKIDYRSYHCEEQQVRSPVNNRRRTKALFDEMIPWSSKKKYPAVYTLQEQDKWDPYWEVWLPSAKQIYLHSSDEYDAAKRLVVSVEHWNLLITLDWFINGNPKDPTWTSLQQWREEHRIAKESETLAALQAKANEGNVAAMKILIDRYSGRKAGKPSKAEVDGEKRRQAKRNDIVSEDSARVMQLVKK